jgi:hypothetical protein
LCLHNRYFGFLESVVDAVEAQFAEWTQPNDCLKDYAQLFKTLSLVNVGVFLVPLTRGWLLSWNRARTAGWRESSRLGRSPCGGAFREDAAIRRHAHRGWFAPFDALLQ